MGHNMPHGPQSRANLRLDTASRGRFAINGQEKLDPATDCSTPSMLCNARCHPLRRLGWSLGPGQVGWHIAFSGAHRATLSQHAHRTRTSRRGVHGETVPAALPRRRPYPWSDGARPTAVMQAACALEKQQASARPAFGAAER